MPCFEWSNLPDTVDPYLLEFGLLSRGQVCMFEQKEGGIFCLPCGGTENINIYGYPLKANIYSLNGEINRTISVYVRGAENYDAQGVICYDNYLRYPYMNYIIESSGRLSDNIRSIDVAVKKLKIPYWLTGNEKQKPAMERTLEQINNNEDRIMINDPLMNNQFTVLSTGANPNLITALWDNFSNTYDVFKETFGINNNAQSDKKERLIVDEVNANNNAVKISLEMRYKSRKSFCDVVNKKWGLNISVNVNDSFLNKGGVTDEQMVQIG